jgi:hypothetical protein
MGSGRQSTPPKSYFNRIFERRDEEAFSGDKAFGVSSSCVLVVREFGSTGL